MCTTKTMPPDLVFFFLFLSLNVCFGYSYGIYGYVITVSITNESQKHVLRLMIKQINNQNFTRNDFVSPFCMKK